MPRAPLRGSATHRPGGSRPGPLPPRSPRAPEGPRAPRAPAGVLAAAAAAIAIALAAWLWPRPPAEPQTVAAGVRLGNHAIGGMPTAELRTFLESLAPGMRVPPEEPRFDPDTRGIIPGLDGMELDVDATLVAALHAPPSSVVEFRFRDVPPKKTLADLPLAPIYEGNDGKPGFAVMINVAWGNEWVAKLLGVLDAHRAKATWFLMGDWAAANPDLAREIADRGHEIASHGYSAVEWDSLSRQEMLNQISQADQAIQDATGVRPFWFSTHKGVVSQGILRAARDLGHETVMWTVDTVDWRKPTVDWMVDRVLKRGGAGSLILMHPTERTPEALDRILTGFEKRGLSPMTLSELLSPERETPGRAGAAGRGESPGSGGAPGSGGTPGNGGAPGSGGAPGQAPEGSGSDDDSR